MSAQVEQRPEGGAHSQKRETLEEAQRRIHAEVALDAVHQGSNSKWNDSGASMKTDASGMTVEPNLWRENAGLIAVSVVVAAFDLLTVWWIYDEIETNANDKVGLI